MFLYNVNSSPSLKEDIPNTKEKTEKSKEDLQDRKRGRKRNPKKNIKKEKQREEHRDGERGEEVHRSTTLPGGDERDNHARGRASFPELWFSWRHQMAALASNGYRAIAPDMRGYGDTDVPADPTDYTIFHIVGDIIGLLDQLELPRVLVVGHDWGATVAWHMCLFRPDRVRALVNLGVPYFPRHPSVKPTDHFKALGEGFYITQYQEPGRAETSFASYDASTVLKKIYSVKMDNMCALPGMEIIDFLECPTSPPEWISENELQYVAEKFQKKGFTGPLNYYRNMDKSWALMAPWQGVKIQVPTKFLVGDKDIGMKSYATEMYIKSGGLKANVPDLDVVWIDGHHYIQQEKAEEVTNEILSYVSSFS